MKLISWLFGKNKQNSPPIEIVIYTRKQCHLCDVAKEQLLHWQRMYRFHLRSIDIDEKVEFLSLYTDKVPVITVDGKERFWGKINEVLFKRLLKSKRERKAEIQDTSKDNAVHE